MLSGKLDSDGMRSAAKAIVVVLMVLQATAQEDTTTTGSTTPTATTPCPIPSCAIGCRQVPAPDGCTICACPDYTCQDVTCGPDQECVMQDVDCLPGSTSCFPQPTCFPPDGTTTETTTETITGPPTTPFCPDVSWCNESDNCYLDYTYLTDGCPSYIWVDYFCTDDACGPDEECVPKEENSLGYICVSRYGTTTIETTPEHSTEPPTGPPTETPTEPPTETPTEPPTETTTPEPPTPCTTITSCDDRNCFVENGPDGCPQCICGDPVCMFVDCGPGEECVPNNENSEGFTCVSIHGTTTIETTPEQPTGPPTEQPTGPPAETPTETPTETTTPEPPTPCPTITSCDDSLCFVENWADGCPHCICGDPICMFVDCGPDEECVPNEENSEGYTCVSIYDSTTTAIPTTSAPCLGLLFTCTGGCHEASGPDGCPTCVCPDTTIAPASCPLITCEGGCQQVQGPDGCFTCICSDTTTTSTTTPTSTTPFPIPPCAVGCRQVPGNDGCPICACPDYTCQDVTCCADEECVMQDVNCPPDTTPCFPQPTCVPSCDAEKRTEIDEQPSNRRLKREGRASRALRKKRTIRRGRV